jgi:hypothetical protein
MCQETAGRRQSREQDYIQCFSSLHREVKIGAKNTSLINSLLCWVKDLNRKRREVSVMLDNGSQQNVAHSIHFDGLDLEMKDP